MSVDNLPRVEGNLTSGARTVAANTANRLATRKKVDQQGDVTKTPKPIFKSVGNVLSSVGSFTSNPNLNNPLASYIGDTVGLLGDALKESPKDILPAFGKSLGKFADISAGFNNHASAESLAIRDNLTNVISNINPVVGGVAKALNVVNDIAGISLDHVDKTAAKNAGVSSTALLGNDIVNSIPILNTIGGLFGSKTAKSFSLNSEGQSISGGYTGTVGDVADAKKLSGKRVLFGGSSMNRAIRDANRQALIVNQLGYTNSLAKNSNYDVDLAQQNLNRYAGTNYQVNAIGKHGMKILSKAELNKIIAMQKLQKGGVIGTDTNILPEGALHARLNHLEDINPDLEDVTKKGIPVLDANGDQVAEIEKEELILRLDVTKKIEELMKDGSDEAMIEAGKLLVSELIDNTQDNTGQLTEEVQDAK